MSNSHDHIEAHAPIDERDEQIEFTILETAIRELSIAKGLFAAEDHRRFMEWYDNIGPTGGARVVAGHGSIPNSSSDCWPTAWPHAKSWESTGCSRRAPVLRATIPT